jgi:antitoxin HigA-1
MKSDARIITRDPAWLGTAVHPGEMLLEEFLRPLGLTQAEAARQLGMSLNRLNELVLGKRGITADTALRLARCFKTTPQLWMHLQADWDLQEELRKGSAA